MEPGGLRTTRLRSRSPSVPTPAAHPYRKVGRLEPQSGIGPDPALLAARARTLAAFLNDLGRPDLAAAARHLAAGIERLPIAA